MTWLAPWAWVGLALLALPVLIHLLGRGPTRRVAFPSLRFIEVSRLLPVRVSTLHDRMLLLLRLLILAAAVAALARPLLPTPVDPSLVPPLVRALIVDTSRSMFRDSPDGGRTVDEARRLAIQMESEADLVRTMATITPAGVLPGAVGWLEQQAGRRELVIISDFQVGVIDSLHLVLVPSEIGIRLLPVAVTIESRLDREVFQATSRRLVRSVPRTATGYEITIDSAPLFALPRVLAPDDLSPAERRAFDAAAAQPSLAAPIDTVPVAVLRLAGAAGPPLAPPATPAVAAYLLRLARQSLLDQAALHLPPLDTIDPDLPVLRHDPQGRPVAQIGMVKDRVPEEVVVVTAATAGHPGAVLVSAALRLAMSVAPSPAELLTDVVPTATLSTWERDAGERVQPLPRNSRTSQRSDGRWLWGVALLLLVGEALLRRRIAATRAVAEVADVG